MLVTIFTDASFDSDRFVGGWGVWAKSEREQCDGGGPIKTHINNVSEAEFMAVCNGIHHSMCCGVTKAGDSLLIQVDNTRVQAIISHTPDPKMYMTTKERDALEIFNNMIKQYEFIVRVRHVKAHKPKEAPRNWCNDQADKHAKRGLKKARTMWKQIRSGEVSCKSFQNCLP